VEVRVLSWAPQSTILFDRRFVVRRNAIVAAMLLPRHVLTPLGDSDIEGDA
jgi:hypothetical protein